MRPVALALLFAFPALSGCFDEPPAASVEPADVPARDIIERLPIDTGFCMESEDGPPPPPGEEMEGIQPIITLFGGSLRHADTRVLLVPPTHGDLTSPQNLSRSGLAYLQATLEGIHAWAPAIDLFIAKYPQFSYLDNITVQVEVFDAEVPNTAGYDIVIGYVETSGPVFRGIALNPAGDTQEPIEEAGLGDLVHLSGRFILLSLYASAPRSGQTLPDFPETHEVRGVTMHEFAHTWGLGHTTTWTPGCGGDLMNSPYPYPYGDDIVVGDGGERSKPLCISSLDLYGLARLYRWLPNGTWEGTSEQIFMPEWMVYEEYCEVHEEAAMKAKADLESALRR